MRTGTAAIRTGTLIVTVTPIRMSTPGLVIGAATGEVGAGAAMAMATAGTVIGVATVIEAGTVIGAAMAMEAGMAIEDSPEGSPDVDTPAAGMVAA